MEIVLFELGDVRYALPAAQVREIVRAVAILPLPGAPRIVEGVIDIRGELAAVLDVRARFDRPSHPLSETDHFIVASTGPRLVAIRADRVTDLTRIEPSDVHDAAPFAGGGGHVSGVARLPDGLVLIHDLRTFLDDGESQAVDRALAGGVRGEGP